MKHFWFFSTGFIKSEQRPFQIKHRNKWALQLSYWPCRTSCALNGAGIYARERWQEGDGFSVTQKVTQRGIDVAIHNMGHLSHQCPKPPLFKVESTNYKKKLTKSSIFCAEISTKDTNLFSFCFYCECEKAVIGMPSHDLVIEILHNKCTFDWWKFNKVPVQIHNMMRDFSAITENSDVPVDVATVVVSEKTFTLKAFDTVK